MHLDLHAQIMMHHLRTQYQKHLSFITCQVDQHRKHCKFYKVFQWIMICKHHNAPSWDRVSEKNFPNCATYPEHQAQKVAVTHAWIILLNFPKRTTKDFFILILYMLILFDYFIFEQNIPPQTPNSIVKTSWFN